GIDEDDWPKIDQVVLEIHDPTGEAAGRIARDLAARGFRCAVEQETLLEHAGLVNLYATRETAEAASVVGAETSDASLERTAREFSAALAACVGASKVPLVLCFAPRSPAVQADARLRDALDAAEAALLAQAAGLAGVHAIASATLARRSPVRDGFDAHGHRVAHMPYTQAGYAAIATAVYRAAAGLRRAPFKVIALDCDNTLWTGVCGEDGPLGVEVTPGHRALQAFVVAQAGAGMLLCLCSKNNEQDALDVFARRDDMTLRREHLVAWRLNWRSKSENLRSLARELNLGLDSFVFVDDSPMECAEVRANCPEVLALELPPDPARIPAFLDHVWAFDTRPATGEDRNRTKMYQQEAERERYRSEALSLKGFVDGLRLEVRAAPVAEAQVPRVSQLTFRTNQFNFTTVRRTEAEIREFIAQPGQHGLAVEVVDRFGDYGLTGVLLYRSLPDRYEVDTFLLSCRVLGRGVEHALVARLGRMAVDDGKALVAFRHARSAKNQPALEFIRAIAGRYANADETLFAVPAAELAAVTYDPGEAPAADEPGGEADRPVARPDAAAGVARSERFQRIATELGDAERIAAAVEAFRTRRQPGAGAEPAGTALETALAAIWRKVLGRTRMGLDENFFDAGGTSLRAVQVIAALRRDLGRSVSIVTLFECPTVRLLAARLGDTEAPAGATAAAAVQRGKQRRYGALRRGAP
ncbi:MAG TPA: HAD-IIIC family phosphatase, partial [Casimicrobiaceae bacterium]|nr:HAD-IIIC family phosphatase [Casimicrobiaceae bacterium]